MNEPERQALREAIDQTKRERLRRINAAIISDRRTERQAKKSQPQPEHRMTLVDLAIEAAGRKS